MTTTTYKAGERPRIVVATGIWKEPVLTKINGTTAYFRAKYIVGELAIEREQVTIITHEDGTPVLETERWPPLTPYDTGARAQPMVWITPDRRRPGAEFDRYGKVDFDNSESNTIVTVWVEGTADGEDVVHIMQHCASPKIVVHLNGQDIPEFEIDDPSHGGTEQEQS